jgi:hypothetical protein
MPCNAFVAGLFFMGAFLLSQKPGFPPFRVLRAPFPVVGRKKSFHPARSTILIITKNTP